jgi:hypothetical protein
MAHTSDAERQACIDECLICHRICLETATHCLELGGEHAEAAHVRALLDCAELCSTSAGFMLRDSPLHGAVCGACASACERCAESCEAIPGSDERMEACAETCRRCAESCRRMAAAAAAGPGADPSPHALD